MRAYKIYPALNFCTFAGNVTGSLSQAATAAPEYYRIRMIYSLQRQYYCPFFFFPYLQEKSKREEKTV
jgi:hypothetical protein